MGCQVVDRGRPHGHFTVFSGGGSDQSRAPSSKKIPASIKKTWHFHPPLIKNPEPPPPKKKKIMGMGVPAERTQKSQAPIKFGDHVKPVKLKPVSRMFRIFRVLASAFSAFSAFSVFSLCGISSDPCFSGVRGTVRIFRIFPVSGSNRWFRKSDRPALLWPALGDHVQPNLRFEVAEGFLHIG